MKTGINILIYFGLFAISTQCKPKNITSQPEVQILSNHLTRNIDDAAYWDSINPIEFLYILKENPLKNTVCIVTYPDSTWFDEKYIPMLELFLDDTSAASVVVSAAESMIHSDTMMSKTSIQAKFLLEGFKSKKYPPTLCSYHHFD